ncbi:MAG: hypothetical protein J0H44_13625 [Alphaproteobacteria bacterium]|nr:hypothetical protein [Alphaproteobacteria bacterium]
MNDAKYVSVARWIEMTGLSRSTTYRLLGQKTIRAIKVNSCLRIDLPHALAALKAKPAVIKRDKPKAKAKQFTHRRKRAEAASAAA